MRVSDIMSRQVATALPGPTVAAAVEALWHRDCGALPVVDPTGKLVGIVTDRDMCIALGTRRRLASELTVGEVMSRSVRTCRASESVPSALATMRTAKVRRLPVVDVSGKVEGMLSLVDCIRCTSPSDGGELSIEEADVLGTLKSVCEQRLPLASPAIARR